MNNKITKSEYILATLGYILMGAEISFVLSTYEKSPEHFFFSIPIIDKILIFTGNIVVAFCWIALVRLFVCFLMEIKGK